MESEVGRPHIRLGDSEQRNGVKQERNCDKRATLPHQLARRVYLFKAWKSWKGTA